MNNNSENSTLQLINKLNQSLNSLRFKELWPEFTPFPYALYDNNDVYLVNYNNPPANYIKLKDNIYKGVRDNNFFGNTAIKFNDAYIAIWNISAKSNNVSYKKLTSKLVHEMFHAYQHNIKDNRYGNELLYLTYPFTEDNLALRLAERKSLIKTIFADNKNQSINYIEKFINYREKRRELIGDYIDYELGMESREGTALYVEYKSLLQLSELPEKYLIANFGSDLAGDNQNLKEFRKSCYSSGLFLCLILKRLAPGWQKAYNNSSKFLYNFLLEHIQYNKEQIAIPESNYSRAIIKRFNEYKESHFKAFNDQQGYKIIINGDFKIAGFDPMNIINIDNRLLHKNFVKLSFKQGQITIKNQAITKHNENVIEINQIQFYTSHKPEIKDDMVKIKDVGDFKASINKKENIFIINIINEFN